MQVHKPLPKVLIWQGRYFVRCNYHDPHVSLGYREIGALVVQDEASSPVEFPS